MILWTILPIDSIFPPSDIAPSYEEIHYQGVNVLAEKINSTQYKVIRVLGTNPQDYLNPHLQPGNVLTYRTFS